MITIKHIKSGFSKVIAIAEKNIKLRTRFKFSLVLGFISPLFALIMPLIIMGTLFKFNAEFGPWNAKNFLVYTFIAYMIFLLRGIINYIPSNFRQEKYWLTLSSLIIAPINQYTQLIGVVVAHLTLISIPFFIFMVICYIYYPISILTLIIVVLTFFLLTLIFSGIGIILGVFSISREDIYPVLSFILNFFFIFSCITYPFELFPPTIQNFVSLNPLYYLFDIIRLVWIEDNLLYSIMSHPIHVILLVSCAFSFPFVGVFIFNKIYRKYGITGY